MAMVLPECYLHAHPFVLRSGDGEDIGDDAASAGGYLSGCISHIPNTRSVLGIWENRMLKWLANHLRGRLASRSPIPFE
jgi:hypothetical protein